MIKLLVSTKGQFQLLDLGHKGQMIHAHRPSIVDNSNFVQDRIGRNQVRVHGELKDEATDAELVKYLAECKGDEELAIDSFMAEFGKEVAEKSKRGKGKGRGKKAEETESDTDETDETETGQTEADA